MNACASEKSITEEKKRNLWGFLFIFIYFSVSAPHHHEQKLVISFFLLYITLCVCVEGREGGGRGG